MEEKKNRIKKAVESFSADYRQSIKSFAQDIIESKDIVSVQLENIFRGARKPTEAQIEKARHRKEYGNPPGKRTDPLGDEISWEQFLGCVDKKQPVWIISKDFDFFQEVLGDLKLKAFLFHELRPSVGSNAPVHCFTDLVTALEHFAKNSGKTVKDLPDEDTIAKIKKEEVASVYYPTSSTSISAVSGEFYPNITPYGNTGPLGTFLNPNTIGPSNVAIGALSSILPNSPGSAFVSPNLIKCPKCGTSPVRTTNLSSSALYSCPVCGYCWIQ